MTRLDLLEFKIQPNMQYLIICFKKYLQINLKQFNY
jgi:hypothetical protein